MWALSYYLTQLSLGCQSSYQQTPRGFETRCCREGHTRPRGPSESSDGVDPNIRRTRHNVTVITVGSKYEVYVQSTASSHMQTLQIKWEVNIFLKKSSCVLHSCVFLPASFLPVSSSCVFLDASFIIVSVFTQYIYVYFCMNQQMTMQHYVLSIVVCIPSTFCPTLGRHQGRIYYKSDVTFVLAYYYYVRALYRWRLWRLILNGFL